MKKVLYKFYLEYVHVNKKIQKANNKKRFLIDVKNTTFSEKKNYMYQVFDFGVAMLSLFNHICAKKIKI